MYLILILRCSTADNLTLTLLELLMPPIQSQTSMCTNFMQSEQCLWLSKLLAGQLQSLVWISPNLKIYSLKNWRWTGPFKKFCRLRIKLKYATISTRNYKVAFYLTLLSQFQNLIMLYYKGTDRWTDRLVYIIIKSVQRNLTLYH